MADDFDSMFTSLVRDEPKGDPTPSISKPDIVNPETAAAAPVVDQKDTTAAQEEPAATAQETPAEEPETEIEGAPAEGEETPEPPPPPETKGAADDALARLADMLSQRDAQRQPQPQPQPQTQQPAPPPFNQEEVGVLNQYLQDYPDIARAESLMRRNEYNALTAHIFREVSAYFAPKLALLEQLADITAYGQIAQRVPNYDAMRDQVAAWVQTQPGYLQAGMNHVIQQGTAEEIADLFDRFSQATGAQAPAAAGLAPGAGGAKPQVPAAKSAAELSPAAKQAVARLAPVNSKRSAPTQGAPQTFDAAFDSFAKAG